MKFAAKYWVVETQGCKSILLNLRRLNKHAVSLSSFRGIEVGLADQRSSEGKNPWEVNMTFRESGDFETPAGVPGLKRGLRELISQEKK